MHRGNEVTRAYTDMDEIARELAQHLATLRSALDPVDGSPQDTALCTVETFCDVALRVMSKTNPSKVQSVARTVEIKARIDGTPFYRSADLQQQAKAV